MAISAPMPHTRAQQGTTMQDRHLVHLNFNHRDPWLDYELGLLSFCIQLVLKTTTGLSVACILLLLMQFKLINWLINLTCIPFSSLSHISHSLTSLTPVHHRGTPPSCWSRLITHLIFVLLHHPSQFLFILVPSSSSSPSLSPSLSCPSPTHTRLNNTHANALIDTLPLPLVPFTYFGYHVARSRV